MNRNPFKPFIPSGVEGLPLHRAALPPRLRSGRPVFVSLVLLTGCIQTTGGRAVSFEAQASGDPAVVTGSPLTFTTPRGFEVTLTRAQVTIGAM